MNKEYTPYKFLTTVQTKNGPVTTCRSCKWCSSSKQTHLEKAHENGNCGYYNRIITRLHSEHSFPSKK